MGAKTSLVSGTFGLCFMSKRDTLSDLISWLRKARTKPHYRRNKVYMRVTVQDKRENKSKKTDKNEETQRY